MISALHTHKRLAIVLGILLLCAGRVSFAQAQETTEAGMCADGVDNDADGYTDCMDNDCAGDPRCDASGASECIPIGQACGDVDTPCCFGAACGPDGLCIDPNNCIPEGETCGDTDTPCCNGSVCPADGICQAPSGGGTTTPRPPPTPQGILLLEPVCGTNFIPIGAGETFGAFQVYFNCLYPWLVGMGAATAVLMGVVGGIQIIMSGADQGARSKGVQRLLMSMGGLVFVLLSATILHVLNPSFFK